MSILNGAISFDVVHPEKQPYGKQLEAKCIFSSTGAMDVAKLHNKFLVVACRGTLEIFDVGNEIQHISTLAGIGEARQISIDGNWAYVSARADGVFICDLRNPYEPKVAGHIDSLELATGVCAANGLLTITNRHMGTELFDVRNPENPVFLNHFLCGEAQSVWLHENLALIGDWMNKQVLLHDISKTESPYLISRFGVDGFADGVCSFESNGRTLCLVATGHHSAKLKNRMKYRNYTYVTAEMINEGYGCGHGIEIYDITDPLYPEYLSSLKTPPHFGGIDTWRVFSDGGICYFTDSINGLFAIELSNPLKPYFIWHFRLPVIQSSKFSLPSIQPIAEQIAGVTSVGGYIFAVSPQSGVYQIYCPKEQEIKEFKHPVAHTNFKVRDKFEGTYFSCSSQIHSFVQYDGFLYVACGKEGIVVLETDSGRVLHRKETLGICHDLCIYKGVLISAEGQNGVASYQIKEAEMNELSRVTFGMGLSVREIVVGRDLCVQLGSKAIAKVEMNDEGMLQRAGELCEVGLMYYRHIARTKCGKFFCVLPISTGPGLIEETEAGLCNTGFSLGRTSCPFEEGACGYNGMLIGVLHRRYICLSNPQEITNLADGAGIFVAGALLKGIPFVCGSKLVLLNRCTGVVEILDISNPHHPAFIKRINTGKYPEFAALVGDNIYVACGYGGILKL